jgi:anti-anti-sigma factor
MRLTLISHTDQVTRLECEGQVTQQELTMDHDPLEAVMGPSLYQRCVLLSLEKTSYIDSSGVSWLLRGHKQFERSGGRLVLHSLSPMVRQVLHLLKLTTLLHVAADEREALPLAQGAKA